MQSVSPCIIAIISLLLNITLVPFPANLNHRLSFLYIISIILSSFTSSQSSSSLKFSPLSPQISILQPVPSLFFPSMCIIVLSIMMQILISSFSTASNPHFFYIFNLVSSFHLSPFVRRAGRTRGKRVKRELLHPWVRWTEPDSKEVTARVEAHSYHNPAANTRL